jgi:hypothetical protein
MSGFSIYIPSVYPNITEEMISHTFNRMNVGRVKHVELVSQNKKSNKAYVFFEALYQSDLAMSICDTLSQNRSAKLTYARNEHVFWVLLSCRREYDGVSSNGEYIDLSFTEEEIAFVESCLEDNSYVGSDYAELLETALENERNANATLQYNQIVLFNRYNELMVMYNNETSFRLDSEDTKGKLTMADLEVSREEGEVV